MTVWEGLKNYKKAVGWSLCFSSAIIMEGYDTTILGSFIISEPFIERFGIVQDDGFKIFTAQSQSALGVAMQSGQILGLLATGVLADKFGFKKVMGGALTWVMGTIFLLFFAKDIYMLLAGEMLMGFPLGIFQTMTITYAAELCPTVLRAYLTTYVNLCWVLGQLFASAVTKGFYATRHDEWVYRIPYALQWVWPVPILIGVIFAPESPWWLVRVGRIEDAKTSITRLASQGASVNADESVAMIVHTNEMEKEISAGTTYLDCFKGIDLRRTEITCLTWACQNLCGSSLMGSSSYFYYAAGLDPSNSYTMALTQYALGIVGVLLSWFAMSKLGRRTLYVYGLAVCCLLMFTVGGISLAPGARNRESPNPTASWATGSMLIVFTFVYDFTVGPVCYALVSEIPSTRLRQKTVVLARTLYNLIGLAMGFIIPYMLNPKAWNMMGQSGFVWAASAFLCFLWAFFRLPEPKDRTFAELDVLFEKKIGARKFRETQVNLFNGDEVEHVTIEVKY